MSEGQTGTRLLHGGLFAGLCGAVVFVRLLPLGGTPGALPPPDLITALLIAWMIRRPDLLPLWVLVPVLYLADMVLMRPPGLWAALSLIMAEALRRRHARWQSMSLGAEIVLSGVLVAGLVGAHWLVLAVFLVDQPPMLLQMAQAPLTAAAYPVAVALCHFGLGLRKRPGPEGFGRKARG